MALPLFLGAQTAPTFTSLPVLTGTYATQYEYSLTTDDVEGSLRTIFLSSGTLPVGISLTDQGDGTAILQGFPQEVGSFLVELKVLESGSPFLEEVQTFTLVIEKAALLVKADDKTRIYGQSNPVLTFSMTGFLNGDDAADINVQPITNTSADPTSSVGEYSIEASGASDDLYDFDYQSGQLYVLKTTLQVQADNKSSIYGATIPLLTATYLGFVNGDDANDLDILPDLNTLANNTSNVGSYAINAGGGSDNNYAFSYIDGTLTIDKADLTITALASSKVYGAPNPTLFVNYSGFMNDDDASDLNVQPTIGTTATLTSAVGDYPITLNGGSDDNYTLQLVNGQLVVSKATLAVSADDKSRTYGTANPTLTFSYSGFVSDDNASDLDAQPTIGTPAILTSDVGNYPITLSGGSDDNYMLTFIDAQLTVAKATLVISAEDKTRLYGAADPEFTWVYSGFLNGDDNTDIATLPTASTTATITSDVGLYPIDVNGGFANNYEFQYQSAQLSISKALLTVSVNNASRTYLQSNPEFPLEFSAFKNGDDVTDLDVMPSVTTTADLNSNAGSYPITISGGDDGNYSFSYGAATLTVNKATATLLITDILQNADGSPKPVSIQTIPPDLNVEVLYNGLASVPSIKGTYAVTAVIDEQNYQGSSSANFVLNGPPVLLSTPAITLAEDSGSQQLNLSTIVDDLEQSETSLQYEIITVSNETLFDEVTIGGVNLNFVLAADKYGVGSIQIRITDAQGLFVDVTLPVTINNVQDLPVFTSTPVIVAAQDVPYTYLITASDVDLEDVLTISSIIALPSWLTLTNHGNGTATLTGTPRAANIGDNGNGIALKVVDNNGGRADQFFSINVLEGQFPPQFTSAALTTARESIAYSYTATTSDFNGGPITYTAPTLPTWLTAISNGTGGFVLSGLPGLSHVFFENGMQDFPVVIRATDNTGLFTEQSFMIRVLYENSPPTAMLQASQITIDEDSGITDFHLTEITDGGEIGQVISIIITSNPTDIVQSTVDYQSPQTSGTIHIQPLLNANGSTVLTIKVQDNGKPSKNFLNNMLTVIVNPINDPPAIVSTPSTRVNFGSNYSYSVVATDPDAQDNLTFQLLTAPTWLNINSINNREAVVSGTVPIDATDALVRIKVSDPAGIFAIQEYNLIVNTAPILTGSSAMTAEDIAIDFSKTFFEPLISDSNADAITAIKITQLPQGLLRFNEQIISLNQEIAWSIFSQVTYTPPLDYFGQDAFSWSVSDGLLFSENSAQVEITIITTNDPPEIRNLETTPIAYSQGDSGSPISTQLTIADVDDANLISAVVTISDSFETSTDELIYTKPAGETLPITSTFNKQTGELTLSGEASKSTYETALRNVKYKSFFLGQTDKLSRKISIKVSDALATSAIVQRNLTIIRVLPDIDVVQAFTPNGDGVNDTWDFNNLIAYEHIRIFVFDSGGRKVYECRNSNCAWDGTFKGNELPPGPYLYTIDLEEGRRQYQGTVTILK